MKRFVIGVLSLKAVDELPDGSPEFLNEFGMNDYTAGTKEGVMWGQLFSDTWGNVEATEGAPMSLEKFKETLSENAAGLALDIYEHMIRQGGLTDNSVEEE